MVQIGQLIGSYRVLRLIGRGGMGLVFEAVHPAIGRRAAIKVLAPHLSADPQLAIRFLNEARAVNLVRHPGLVEIFEFGRLDDGTAFIIMDFLDGETLAAVLQRQESRIERSRAVDVVRQLAAALAAAHRGGVVHRDLKPENVMLIADVERPGAWRVKILDFGIAKLAQDSLSTAAATETRPGVAMGTPAYMSPEQCLGAGQVDGQADVYSLGVLFFELLAGFRPFESTQPQELMRQHLHSTPRSLRGLGIPEEFARLVEAMLAKSPSERPTMGELLQALAPPAGRISAEPSPPPPSLLSARAVQLLPTLDSDQSLSSADGEDFFIAGPPIAEPRQFFGRQREVRRLFSLWRRTPLQNAVIVGPKRSGKTSLLHYLRQILRAKNLRPDQRTDLVPDPTRYRFLYIDFQDPRMGTKEGFLSQVLHGLGLPVPSPCTLERVIPILSDSLHSPTVLLLDEVSVALDRYADLDTPFWEGLRALAINQVGGQLGFVLASAHPPHELAARHASAGSPFFNIFGYSATLGPLGDAEARGLLASSPLPFSEGDTDWILRESGGWPILLQILARERLLALQEGLQNDEWKPEAQRQMQPFRHLLRPGNPT